VITALTAAPVSTPTAIPVGGYGSVTIDDRCTACGACLLTCPTRALVVQPLRPGVIDRRCTGCLACVEICPRGAISPVNR
jgi:ferredoxin